MAKRKPTLSIPEMESALGYGVDPTTNLVDADRFYSDLTPVSDDRYDRTEKEYRTSSELQRLQCRLRNVNAILPAGNQVKTIVEVDNSVHVRPSNFAGLYKFFVDINYGFGLNVRFLFTESEALETVAMAQLQQPPTIVGRNDAQISPQRQLLDSSRSPPNFMSLPRELRDRIYNFVLNQEEWRSETGEHGFCHAIGDPSGFYFPFDSDATLLRVNRRIRQEALPLAYRNTKFHLVDMDDVVRFLIMAGRIGRENIEFLKFSWESPVDLEYHWHNFPNAEDTHLRLPALHVDTCMHLLKHCTRLKSLQLIFDPSILSEVPRSTFQSDPGILLLCSIRGINEVRLLDSDAEPLDDSGVGEWLRSQLMSQAKDTGAEVE